MYSHFTSYLGICSTEEGQIHNAATLHVAYPILSIPCLLMPWRLKEPGHQHAWYWPNKPDISISNIKRVNIVIDTVPTDGLAQLDDRTTVMTEFRSHIYTEVALEVFILFNFHPLNPEWKVLKCGITMFDEWILGVSFFILIHCWQSSFSSWLIYGISWFTLVASKWTTVCSNGVAVIDWMAHRGIKL